MKIKQKNNNYEYYIDDSILSLNNKKSHIEMENTSVLSNIFFNALIKNKNTLPTFSEHFLENKLFLEGLSKVLKKKEQIFRIT